MARLANINLAVSDPARSLAFYRSALGLRETPRSAPPGFIQLWADDAGTLTLSLQQRGASSAAAQPGGCELGFEVDDLEAARAALEAAGAGAVTPQRMGWGEAIDARDPDGHALTIYRLRR